MVIRLVNEYCVDCGTYYKCIKNSVILVDWYNACYVRCDLYECPSCGHELIPRSQMGNPVDRWKNPDQFDAIINTARQEGRLYEVD